MNIEESIVILRGLKPLYEKAHGVYITGEALETVTKLSARYIAAKKLPDKAIDILDTACARVSTAKDTPPKRLSYLDNKIHEINVAIAEFERDYQLGETVDSTVKTKLENQLTELAEEKICFLLDLNSKALVEEFYHYEPSSLILKQEYTEERQELIAQLQAKKAEYEAIKPEECLIHAEVGSKQITAVIADLTGIPVNSMTGDELTKLTELLIFLTTILKVNLKPLSKFTKLAHCDGGFTPCRHTIGALLLVGPSGVGKLKPQFKLQNISLVANNS
ncbi:MAG: hypothetical protein ACLR5Y_02145 [Haemophilus parainfluenzae]